MAGQRARKLDISALIQGGHNVASMLSSVDESGGIAGLLGGVAGGITKYGANRREDKQRAEAKDERQKDRAFSQSMALKADARAESDQAMQKTRFGWESEDRAGVGGETDSLLTNTAALTKRGDAARQIAADTKIGETFATALARQVAASATGMPPDPLTLKQIQDSYAALQAKGGLQSVMARGAALQEDDIEGLVSETAQVGTLKSLLIARMGREKNSVKHAALGDALVQLSAIEDVNKYRIRLHEANTKRKDAVDEAKAKAATEAAVKSASDKADLDAFNADLKAKGEKPVSSLEYGKMRERERGIDERTRENATLRRELDATRAAEAARKQDEVERENRAKEAGNAAILEIRQSAEKRAQGKAGFDVEAEIDKSLDKRIDDARAAMVATDTAWYRLVSKSKSDPERAELAKRRQHYETLLGTLTTEREKRAAERLGAPAPTSAPAAPAAAPAGDVKARLAQALKDAGITDTKSPAALEIARRILGR